MKTISSRCLPHHLVIINNKFIVEGTCFIRHPVLGFSIVLNRPLLEVTIHILQLNYRRYMAKKINIILRFLLECCGNGPKVNSEDMI